MQTSTRHPAAAARDTGAVENRGDPAGGNELGAFLRSRRAALDPRRAGLPDDGRLRRVPGLRREELAQLAHVSVDYVVRLEQGRTRRVSRPVLDSLAEALQLAPDERDYLLTIAESAPAAPARRPGRPAVAPRLRQLLQTMPDIPAMVLSRRMDVLAWNRGAAALLTDFAALAPAARNLIRLTFLDEAFRALYADWPRAARDCVAVLRMEAGRTPHDPALNALVGELGVRDPDFRTWWASHRVRGPQQLTKTYHHPVAGTLTLEVQQFSVDTHPDQQLIAYTAEPGSPSHEALHFLLQWSATRTNPDDDRAGRGRRP
ncbi:helix-turn-helix domain-containing protein [Actinopolymorpha pittospori]|uniref:Transcriptional regulator with XRE-family HTH domain n=1 Tax=Actinopolymorpha pittospori TaxID=648752 RepID=A0A927N168_9ACTN|nr:helix-turn-helix transcriptional regulator [Actinopolymorpha pittospori]MBE1608413.1 transcriptional regulator with XRE-family HTH domain [Actinopolymorpha pittospori]